LPILGDTLDAALFGRGFGRKVSGGTPAPANSESGSGENLQLVKLNLPPPPESSSKESGEGQRKRRRVPRSVHDNEIHDRVSTHAIPLQENSKDSDVLFSRIGWLRKPHELEEQYRMGFGLCDAPGNRLPHRSTNVASEVENWLWDLRTECEGGSLNVILTLAQKGCLSAEKVNPLQGSYLEIDPKCGFPIKSYLPSPSKELRNLVSKGFEISLFSQSAMEVALADDALSAVTHFPIRVLENMAIESFIKAREKFPNQLISLTRSMVKTLKTAITKTIQDYVLSCPYPDECDEEGRYTIRADMAKLVGVLEYISTGAEPWQVDWPGYMAFKRVRGDFIQNKVSQYLG